MTYREFMYLASEKLYNDKNCPAEQKDRGTAVFEAKNLVMHFSGEKYTTFSQDENIPENILSQLEKALSEKLSGMPLQYILGEWEFYGERIFCGKGCLIPRPETEFLAEFAIKTLPENAKFLDICTGSGCIPVAILKNRKDTAATAIDICPEALFYAKRNTEYHKLSDRIEIVLSDMREYEPQEKYDLILSNPPYIKTSDMEKLSDEVKKEPYIALDGGEDGLMFYRIIVERFEKALKDDGAFAFEAGEDTSHGVGEILESRGFEVQYIKDYSGIKRVIIGRKRK